MSVFGFQSTYVPSFMKTQPQGQPQGGPMGNPLFSMQKQGPGMMSASPSAPGSQAAPLPSLDPNVGGQANPFAINLAVDPANVQAWSDPAYHRTNRETSYMTGPFGYKSDESHVNTYTQEAWKNPLGMSFNSFDFLGHKGMGDVKIRSGQDLYNTIKNMSVDQLSQLDLKTVKDRLAQASQNLSNAYANPNFAAHNAGQRSVNPGPNGSKDLLGQAWEAVAPFVGQGTSSDKYNASTANFGLGSLEDQTNWLNKAYQMLLDRSNAAYLF